MLPSSLNVNSHVTVGANLVISLPAESRTLVNATWN